MQKPGRLHVNQLIEQDTQASCTYHTLRRMQHHSWGTPAKTISSIQPRENIKETKTERFSKTMLVSCFQQLYYSYIIQIIPSDISKSNKLGRPSCHTGDSAGDINLRMLELLCPACEKSSYIMLE